MKFYDENKFSVVDLLFWAFVGSVAAVCAFGVLLYFKD
jgi:hypothetical protein